ncbi:MAG: VOC family protein, partial [Rhodobacteraceae bacterium]|nr:VOC family protein [Paracoccaceae bacterium]
MTTETTSTTTSPGLHHVTAIAGDPQRNHAFYTGTLGLRMVKQTVNFDDPTTYHLYYGDSIGAPGTIMTFFPWVNLPKGRVGLGQAVLTQFIVPRGSLAFWTERLDRLGKGVMARETLFGEERLVSLDPDGLPFALVEVDAPAAAEAPERLWVDGGVPASFAIRGFYGITLALSRATGTAEILTDIFGYTQEAETDWPKGDASGRLIRYRSPAADG